MIFNMHGFENTHFSRNSKRGKKLILAAFVLAFGATTLPTASAYFEDFNDLQVKTYTRAMETRKIHPPQNTLKNYFFYWNNDENPQYNAMYRDHLLARIEAFKPRIQSDDFGTKRQIYYLENQLKKSDELEVLLQYAENQIDTFEKRYSGSPRERRASQHYNASQYLPLMKVTRPELLSKPQQRYYLSVE